MALALGMSLVFTIFNNLWNLALPATLILLSQHLKLLPYLFEWLTVVSTYMDFLFLRKIVHIICFLSKKGSDSWLWLEVWKILHFCVLHLLSVQFSRSVMFDSLWPYVLQYARLPCPSPAPGAYLNSCPLSQWCHPTISTSVIPFFPAVNLSQHQGSFPMSQFFVSGGQNIGVSASASILPINIQDWFPLGWTDWISLQSKGLSRVFSNTTVQKHQFFSAQLSSQSNSHIHTWLLEKP